MAWSRRQKPTCWVYLPKPKGKPVQITKNPRVSPGHCLKQVPPGAGLLEQGWATSPAHGSAEGPRLSCSCRGQAELTVLHAVSYNDKVYQNYKDSLVLLPVVAAPTNVQFHFSDLFKSSSPHGSANLSCKSQRGRRFIKRLLVHLTVTKC